MNRPSVPLGSRNQRVWAKCMRRLHAGKGEAGEAWAEKVARKKGDDPDLWAIAAMCARLSTKDLDREHRLLLEGIRVAGPSRYLLHNLEENRVRARDLPGAREAARQLEELEGDSPVAHLAWARIYKAERRPDDAVAQVKRAAELAPHDANVLAEAAYTLLEIPGQRQLAEDLLSGALDNPEAATANVRRGPQTLRFAIPGGSGRRCRSGLVRPAGGSRRRRGPAAPAG
jgi:tetratricopeptide (TPR) repeat protein